MTATAVVPVPAIATDATRAPVVAGIRVSHPDRQVYPELGISKLQFARYFEAIGSWILPHVRGRPLTLVHCPAGVDAACSYMKHAKAWGPTVLRRVRIQEKTKVGEYLVADSVAAVVALAQMGVVEIHTWNSTAESVERPNRIVWDLDPGPGIAWTQTIGAAALLRELLRALGLECWVKTTGGRGLHIVVPIVRSLEWQECLAFSRQVAEAMVRLDPGLFTTAFGKQGRDRKILIDYLRNNRTNTSICAYSPRARPGAPVSVPIQWSELVPRLRQWTIRTVARRLQRLPADPWSGYWTASQRVTKTSLRTLHGVLGN
jgi:bifunctional non-homologous end joining protein LigD